MKQPGKLVLATILAGLLSVAGAAAASGWRLPDLEGREVGPADYPGRWVVVNYWATWCKPCREEMPALDAIARGQDDVAVLGVAWEDTGPAELEAFLERVSVSYPVVQADPFDPPPGVEAPRVLPTTLVFGPDGALAKRFHGPVSRSDILHVVESPEEVNER